MTIRRPGGHHLRMTRPTIVSAAALLVALVAAPALAQEGVAPDSTPPADSAAADPDSLAADSLPADSAAAEADAGPRGVPSLEGYRKVAIVSRDLAPSVRGYETSVEMHRGADGAQVLRFVTGGTPWALVVRPAGGAEAYTLRDFDCSGGFTEELQAGTPLAVPDCALPSPPEAAPAAAEDDDD